MLAPLSDYVDSDHVQILLRLANLKVEYFTQESANLKIQRIIYKYYIHYVFLYHLSSIFCQRSNI